MRRRAIIASAAALAIACSLPALAEPAPVLGTARDSDGKPLPFGRAAYRSLETPLGTGPFKAVMEQDRGLADHTLHVPPHLGAAEPLPHIVWCIAACLNAASASADF